MDSGRVLLCMVLSDEIDVLLVYLEFCAGSNLLSVKRTLWLGLERLHDAVDTECVTARQLARLGHDAQTD